MLHLDRWNSLAQPPRATSPRGSSGVFECRSERPRAKFSEHSSSFAYGTVVLLKAGFQVVGFIGLKDFKTLQHHLIA